MSEVPSMQSRPLLLPEEQLKAMRTVINPLIDGALKASGWVEESTTSERILLDSSNVMPSRAYRAMFGRNVFEGLNLATRSDVFEHERHIVEANISLHKIGGFTASHLTMRGNSFHAETPESYATDAKLVHKPLDADSVLDVLQDIRAYTELGYSCSDTPVPAQTVLQELEGLHTLRVVDRRAEYGFNIDDSYGKVSMRLGQSFSVMADKDTGRFVRRNIQRYVALRALQPLWQGEAELGVEYVSTRNKIAARISAFAPSEIYSQKELGALYAHTLKSLQEKDTSKFQRVVVQNLHKVIDPNSEVIRLR